MEKGKKTRGAAKNYNNGATVGYEARLWQMACALHGNSTVYLAPHQRDSFMLANDSMSFNQSCEGEIRKSLIEANIVDRKRPLPCSKNELVARCGASQ